MSKDGRLLERIDACLVPEAQEEITPGHAWAGMSLNGLGFPTRPLSFTPQFCANQPLDLLCRAGVRAEMCHRFTLGRPLAAVDAYGCDRLLRELALAVCAQEGRDQRFNHLDTTSFSLRGDAVPASDEPALCLPHGDAKAHRPAWQQAGLARMGAQDGGGPLVSQRWEGNASETPMFQERAAALMPALQRSPTPRYVVADGPWSPEDHAANLKQLGFLPRLPHPLKRVAPVVPPARAGNTGQRLDAPTRSHRIEVGHSGRAQRWLVVASQAAVARAEATVSQARQRAGEAIEQPRLPLQAQRCETPEGAHAALAALAPPWTSPQGAASPLRAPKPDVRKGRPTPTPPIAAIDGQMPAQGRPEQQKMADRTHHKACLVVGTTMVASQRRDGEGLAADPGQAHAAGGCRLLKDPRCLVSSLLVKTPCRRHGRLMVLTCALRVYAVTPRRLRQPWARRGATGPNQLNPPTARPPWRWVFQRLAGMHRVRVTVPGKVHDLLEGLHEVPIKIWRVFGGEVCRLYHISSG